MKKNLFLIFILVLTIACSSSDDSAGSTSSSSPYNPPSWIHGTWGLKANGVTLLNDNPFYTFTSDNVCQLTGVSTLCWKESIAQSPTILSGNDVSTSTTYTANFIQSSGSVTLTLSFEKVSATKILWLNTSSGSIQLEKLN